MDLKQTVSWWVITCFDELFKEKIKSCNKIKKNDFKSAVEQFTNLWETVTNKPGNRVKTR